MKCTLPKHMTKGKPTPITKLKFNRKCRDKECKYLQYEITPEQKIVNDIIRSSIRNKNER